MALGRGAGSTDKLGFCSEWPRFLKQHPNKLLACRFEPSAVGRGLVFYCNAVISVRNPVFNPF
jgi:hypothetical protein